MAVVARAVAAGHDVQQIEHLRRLDDPSHKRRGSDNGAGRHETHATRRIVFLHAGRLVLAQDHLLRPILVASQLHFTAPRKTCEMVLPSLPTSTPNSVPRSVTTAVGCGRKTGARGEGRAKWLVPALFGRGLGWRFARPSTLIRAKKGTGPCRPRLPLDSLAFHPRRQFA